MDIRYVLSQDRILSRPKLGSSQGDTPILRLQANAPTVSINNVHRRDNYNALFKRLLTRY
jgi:hypothetical protein